MKYQRYQEVYVYLHFVSDAKGATELIRQGLDAFLTVLPEYVASFHLDAELKCCRFEVPAAALEEASFQKEEDIPSSSTPPPQPANLHPQADGGRVGDRRGGAGSALPQMRAVPGPFYPAQ